MAPAASFLGGANARRATLRAPRPRGPRLGRPGACVAHGPAFGGTRSVSRIVRGLCRREGPHDRRRTRRRAAEQPVRSGIRPRKPRLDGRQGSDGHARRPPRTTSREDPQRTRTASTGGNRRIVHRGRLLRRTQLRPPGSCLGRSELGPRPGSFAPGNGHCPHLLPGNRHDHPRASVAGLPRRDSAGAVSASPRPGNPQSVLRHRRPPGLWLERRRLRRERRRLRHRRGGARLAQAVRPGRGGGFPRHQLLANRLHGRTAPPPPADDLRSVLGGSGRRSLHGTAQLHAHRSAVEPAWSALQTRNSAGTTTRQ